MFVTILLFKITYFVDFVIFILKRFFDYFANIWMIFSAVLYDQIKT